MPSVIILVSRSRCWQQPNSQWDHSSSVFWLIVYNSHVWSRKRYLVEFSFAFDTFHSNMDTDGKLNSKKNEAKKDKFSLNTKFSFKRSWQIWIYLFIQTLTSRIYFYHKLSCNRHFFFFKQSVKIKFASMYVGKMVFHIRICSYR